ncbi:MAG TPA: GNAT family N-acetyltransferase [Acidimicrobiales bacterium]|nr:GNAT family N-acetyltransferase [Acidimicrobiales bacterium]
MIVRPRTKADLDALAVIAADVQELDGYPVRYALDLRTFVEAPGAFAAWVAEDDRGVFGHVALNPRSSPPVMARVFDVLGHSQVGVVARLLVAPVARRTGIAAQLLRTAADDARARGLHPVLDVVATFEPPRALYEREGWRDVGTVLAVYDGFSVEEAVYLAPG